jgi:hypothetical protein
MKPKRKIRQHGGLVLQISKGFFYSFNAGVKRRPGRAVRLDEMLDGCDAACSGDINCRDERAA